MSSIDIRFNLLKLATEIIPLGAVPATYISAAKFFENYVFGLNTESDDSVDIGGPVLEPSVPKKRRKKEIETVDGLSGDPVGELGIPDVPAQNPLKQSTKAAKAPVGVVVPNYTVLQSAMVDLVEAGEAIEKGMGRKAGADVLAQFGVKKATELQKEQWQECIDLLLAAKADLAE